MVQAVLGYETGAQAQVRISGARGAFIQNLLEILEDTRLLILPQVTDTTTTTDESRNARVVTWSESLRSFDVPPQALQGYGTPVQFNGSDEEGDIPDADNLSFGDGAVDLPFSVVALIRADENDALMTIIAKENSASAEEWALFLDASGHPNFKLTDESATATLERRDATAVGTTAYVLLVATYDGTAQQTGIHIYKDGVEVDDTDDSSGTYTAMENTAALVHIGARYTTKEQFFDGRIALLAVCGKQLSIDEVWSLREAVNSWFGL